MPELIDFTFNRDTGELRTERGDYIGVVDAFRDGDGEHWYAVTHTEDEGNSVGHYAESIYAAIEAMLARLKELDEVAESIPAKPNEPEFSDVLKTVDSMGYIPKNERN